MGFLDSRLGDGVADLEVGVSVHHGNHIGRHGRDKERDGTEAVREDVAECGRNWHQQGPSDPYQTTPGEFAAGVHFGQSRDSVAHFLGCVTLSSVSEGDCITLTSDSNSSVVHSFETPQGKLFSILLVHDLVYKSPLLGRFFRSKKLSSCSELWSYVLYTHNSLQETLSISSRNLVCFF